MLYNFFRRTEYEVYLKKRLKVSYVRNSGQKHLVSYKYKENKRNCIFLDIGFNYYYQKCKIEISLNLCTELACYNETV